MKRKYISDIIGCEFVNWDRSKVILNTQTGTGKSTFVVKQLLPYYGETGKRVLLLGNRTLLKWQYLYDFAKSSMHHEEYDHVKLETYQKLTEVLVGVEDIGEYFEQYDVVILDEFHYFIADADFNSETYILWKYLLMWFQNKTMILISATVGELKLLMDDLKTIEDAAWTKSKTIQYSLPTDYSYLKPLLVSNWDEAAYRIAKSTKKTVVFVDDKAKASELAEKLQKFGVRKSDISMLNSEIVHGDQQPEVVKNLAMASKLICIVLITTSVLDNGVSVKDDVGTLVIQTESPTSFIQMLGRVRISNPADELELMFVAQKPSFYEEKMRRCENILSRAEDAVCKFQSDKSFERKIHHALMKPCLNCDDCISEADVYKKIFTYTLEYTDLSLGSRYLRPKRECGKLVVNEFALEKMRQNVHNERKMHALSRERPEGPALALLGYIGIDEIDIGMDTYKSIEEDSFKKEILEVKDFSQEQWKEKQHELMKKYYKSLFSTDKERDDRGFGTPENTNKILSRFGLRLVVISGQKNSYSVVEI